MNLVNYYPPSPTKVAGLSFNDFKENALWGYIHHFETLEDENGTKVILKASLIDEKIFLLDKHIFSNTALEKKMCEINESMADNSIELYAKTTLSPFQIYSRHFEELSPADTSIEEKFALTPLLEDDFNLFFYELETEIIDTYLINFLKENISNDPKKDFYIKFKQHKSHRDTDALCFEADILSWRSPLIWDRFTLSIDDIVYTSIITSYIKPAPTTATTTIEAHLNTFFTDEWLEHISTLNIFHVGQGLNSSVFSAVKKNKVSTSLGNINYDIGYSKYIKKDNSLHVKIPTDALNPKVIILSHWHIDHFWAVPLYDPNIFDAIWIVPDFSSTLKYPHSAKRLLSYVYFKYLSRIVPSGTGTCTHKPIVIDNTFDGHSFYEKCYKNTSLTLFRASTPTGSTETMKNNESLLMHLTKNHTEVLLTGDTYYKYFLNAIKLINGKTITFEDTTILQAPHHGGGVSDTSCLGAGRSRYFKKLKQIIIPVGKNNYVHPNYPNHVDVLIPYTLKKSIKIHRTDWDGHFTTKL